MTTKTAEQLEVELAELRGAVRDFVDGARKDMEEAEHELRVFYTQVVFGVLGCLVGWAIGSWLWG